MTPPRADAARNREALLGSASELFNSEGPEVALDAVARHAGVSIATLYRHFPSREHLVAETYRAEIESLGDVESLLAGHDGAGALDAWTTRFVRYAGTKRALGEVMHQLAHGSSPTAREAVVGAIDRLLAAGAADGTLRTDLDAADVLAMFAGIWSATEDPAWVGRVERLRRFVVDGLSVRR